MELEGVPHSDARVTLMNFTAHLKYKAEKGEWGAPGIKSDDRNYPDRIATDLFRFVSTVPPEIARETKVEVDAVGREETKERLEADAFSRKRSIHELMWEGWDGETALRLGEVEWKYLANYFWKDYLIRLHFAGNEDMLFDIFTGNPKVFNERNFSNVVWWSNYKTALSVAIGDWAVTDGNNREWFEKRSKQIGEIKELIQNPKKTIPYNDFSPVERRAVKNARDKIKKDPKENTPKTKEGWEHLAKKQLLKEEKQEIIYKTNATLWNSAKWYYGHVVASLRDKRTTEGGWNDARKTAKVYTSERERINYEK